MTACAAPATPTTLETPPSTSLPNATTTTTTLPDGQPFPVGEITVGDTALTVWIADTPANRQQGLMEVEALPDGVDGMLFVFELADRVSFWMFNTLIPLDIWWFDADGVLAGTTLMQPCESQPCPTYPSPGPVLHALETPAGEFVFFQGDSLRR